MACACKVNRDLSYLNKKYGTKDFTSPKSDIKSKLPFITKTVFIGLLLIMILPFIFFLVLFNKNKIFDISKFIKRKKDADK